MRYIFCEVTLIRKNEVRQIDPMIQEYIDCTRHEIRYGPLQRCPTHTVHCVDLHRLMFFIDKPEKYLHQATVILKIFANKVQWCRSFFVDRIHIGASFQQYFRRPHVAVFQSQVQWCVTLTVADIDLNRLTIFVVDLEKRLYQLIFFESPANGVQRSRSLLVGQIRIGASSQHQFGQFFAGNVMQRCATPLVPGVDL
uniref:Uncharacterized protein n=1 Tax=Trichogramma kaykai TaxID=54128 RepID=A0ABD2XKY9_9HYME